MKHKHAIKCDCGCGKEVYHNRLVEVTIEQAVDKSLRKSVTARRFWVTTGCKDAFENELGMMVQLQCIVQRYAPLTWWKRLWAARTVLRLQHAIHERTKGFDYARRRAKQSAILFAAPRFLQGFLARRFCGRLAEYEKNLNGAYPQAA